MENVNLELEKVDEKDVLNVTGLTKQHFDRMNIQNVQRKKKTCTKADNQVIIDDLFQFLMDHSTIANRDTDSRKIGNEIQRSQYLNEPHDKLFSKFLATNGHKICKMSLWLIIKKHQQFRIFKTSTNRNLQVALCDKCIRLQLLKSNLANTDIACLDPDDLIEHSVCDDPKIACYKGTCQSCSKSVFTDYIKGLMPDHIDQNTEFKYAELRKSKDGEDIIEATTSIQQYITDNIPKIFYDLGTTGTGSKMACHLLRVKETNQYQKWCYSQVQNGDSIAFHMDYAMSLERRYGMETQNLHFKRKAFPVMGLIEYLPAGRKYWNWWCGELDQSKSAQFTVKAVKDMVSKLPEQMDDPQSITKVFINSDGATAEFWQSELVHYYPKVYDDIKKVLPNIEELFVSKSASGHGKGEIDAS